MDMIWWVALIVGITFYTLWVAGAFKKKGSAPNQENDSKKE